METYQEEFGHARKSLSIADHILTQTYPLVNDPKLLVVVAENLYKAVGWGVSSILSLERLQKRIPPYHDSFSDKMRVFRARNLRRYRFRQEYIDLVTDLYQQVQERKKAPVEFSRKEKYVLADEDYHLTQLTKENMRKSLALAKLFIQDIAQWIQDHE